MSFGSARCRPRRRPDPVEVHEVPSITPIVDGPYRVRGAVGVVGADGRAYEARERQTLCRCGQSRTKPFCDGSHWYAGFRDPLPPEMAAPVPTLYEWAGGIDALERLTERFYDAILTEPDPILEPVFRGMDRGHPAHVAAWLAETFGGPRTYTEHHGGYEHMVAKHKDLGLTETQRPLGRPYGRDRRRGRLACRPRLPRGVHRLPRVGHQDRGVQQRPRCGGHRARPVPRWGWGEAAPFRPQPWDAPDAAERGRERYAREQEQASHHVVEKDRPRGDTGRATPVLALVTLQSHSRCAQATVDHVTPVPPAQ